MKKILVFTENYLMGGGNLYTVDLCNALAQEYQIICCANQGALFEKDLDRLNPDVTQIYPFFMTQAGLWHRLKIEPKRIHRLVGVLLEPLFTLVNLILFLYILNQRKPDLVLCSNGGFPAARACLLMLVAARLYGTRTWLSVVSTARPRGRFLGLWESIQDKIVFASADRVTGNSRAVIDSLAASRNLNMSKTSVIYNGIEDIEPVSRLAKSPLILGSLGRVEEAKGCFELIEAMAILIKSCPEIKLYWAGTGHAMEAVKAKIALCGLESTVIFKGMVQDMQAMLEAYDIFVFPSHQEGFPYAILEAMRAGLPIVTTGVGGIPEAIKHHQNGLLCEARSVKSLVQALELLIKDPELRKCLGQKARQTFVERFSKQKMQDTILNQAASLMNL